MPKILWATTFSKDMWETSAKHLIETFVSTGTGDKLVAYTEGMNLPATPNATGVRLEADPFLQAFLAENAIRIPKELGGKAPEPLCRCPRGPYDAHSSKHRLPCVGYWFCRNAFRWLRKVRAANLAATAYARDFDILMWVDADAGFLKTVPPEVVESWFAPDRACVYVKNKRTAIETGIVGYHLKRGGDKILRRVAARYSTGKFKADRRWDDCVQLERGLAASQPISTADLATAVGPNNTVLQFSPLGEYLSHDKGLHRRTGVLK